MRQAVKKAPAAGAPPLLSHMKKNHIDGDAVISGHRGPRQKARKGSDAGVDDVGVGRQVEERCVMEL